MTQKQIDALKKRIGRLYNRLYDTIKNEETMNNIYELVECELVLEAECNK